MFRRDVFLFLMRGLYEGGSSGDTRYDTVLQGAWGSLASFYDGKSIEEAFGGSMEDDDELSKVSGRDAEDAMGDDPDLG